MGLPKGGKKLKRGPKHAGMYKAQFDRTARNKKRQAQKRRDRAEYWKLAHAV